MADTSHRILRLLSLLSARIEWSGPELAQRLEVSSRTLRRDVETLRDLGYPVHAFKGPHGGYRLGAGGKLPPLVLDDDQAIAIALALQTAPATVTGIDDAVARALTTLRQVMPARLRAASDAFEVTSLQNYWEFSAPPIDVETLQSVGSAIRNSRTLRFDYVAGDPDSQSTHDVEPHHLVSGPVAGTSSLVTGANAHGAPTASTGFVPSRVEGRASLRIRLPPMISTGSSYTILIGVIRRANGRSLAVPLWRSRPKWSRAGLPEVRWSRPSKRAVVDSPSERGRGRAWPDSSSPSTPT